MKFSILFLIFAFACTIEAAKKTTKATPNLCNYSFTNALTPSEIMILDHYTPSREFCRALVNPDVYISGLYQNERDITCLLMGFRNVVISPEVFFNRLNDQKPSENEAFNALKNVLKERLDKHQIHILKSHPDVILYTNTGKKNAYLLNKQLLEDVHNPFLFGTLLGYRPEDIDFFYKIAAFQGLHNFQLPPSYEFYFWLTELKEKFYYFEKNTWRKSDACKKYYDDKNNTQKWINKNSQRGININF